MPLNTPEVLIIAVDAGDYARHVDAVSGGSIPCRVCNGVEAARDVYANQAVVMGEPDLIAEVIAEMPSVQWVQSCWAGVKPLLAAGRSDYRLTGVKGIFGQVMTEYVLGYLLAHELKILRRAEYQQERVWRSSPSGSLKGKKAGIMGTGSIGAHIAGSLTALGVQVSGLNRSGNAVKGFDQVLAVGQISSFLADLDYLISVLPDTPDTRHLLNAAAFDALPDHALLVNVGRGNIVDDGALIAALRANKLAGAVLDVFDEEPLPADNPLWTAPNLRITAHVAADSRAEDIAPIFVANYQRFVRGEELHFAIDFSRGY
jgi:phosphoglycerate dehydrogenase-like enzyme